MFFKSRQRQVHQRIRREIESRMARTGAPREISAFLLERWALLLAGIYFSHGDQHPDWEAGWHTVNALLWSLLPKRDRAETERCLRLLPTLLGRLQEGCDAMALPAAERDQLFSQLAMLHAVVTRAGLQAAPDEEGPITRLGADADLAMDETEIAALDTTHADLSAPGSAHAEYAQAIDRLRVGDEVFFQQPDGDRKLVVQWISPMGGMYLFTDAQGFNALSLTLARLAEKFARKEAWQVTRA